MNIVFLTLVEINSITERGLYQDLLRKFRDEGHSVTIVTPVERRRNIATNFTTKDGVEILQVKTFNIQKTNIIEKGIGTLAITFAKVIEYIKNRDQAKSYLLLKDIFPQNAVDMGMLKKGGIIHRQFLKKERKLYRISDAIGCMSPANVDFLLEHNREIPRKKVEVNPNTIKPLVVDYTHEQKLAIREKYGIPTDKTVFVYGGNLGKPQGLDFLLETIEATKNEHIFFLIVGDGTEFERMKEWFMDRQPQNAKLLQRLPKDDYDKLLGACNIGLIFLDRNFLIPNFPSRLLSYLEMKMPVLAATDPNTDIGDIVEQANCGYKVLAGDQEDMQAKIKDILNANLAELGSNAEKLLMDEYQVDRSYKLIMNRI